ncbi:MAG: CRISPR system precrRNA processing endoribonuclease RAMP protein Cas6 [Thiobacillus sp.]|nr:CRISPR system precrRNA processing endoribonuclease RAMP protein Cas6 [Thiobacillus sp.]
MILLPTPFPAARYRFEFTVETPMRLPEYAGSALRGAFGHAFKRTVCVTREKDCKACPLYRGCAYPAVFAPPAPESHAVQKFSDIPAPYVIEPPSWGEKAYPPGEKLSFQLVLVGQALKHLPTIVHAWQRALQHGVGPGDGTATLDRVTHLAPQGEHIVFDTASGVIEPHSTDLAIEAAAPHAVSLGIVTPLRLQANGKPLGPNEIRADRLLVGLVKRTALISELHCGAPLALDFHALAKHATAVADEKRLAWRDWTRYSNRQKQEMKLGGVVGEWRLDGDLAPFWPFLFLGQWLHVGKNAAFGLGHYQLGPV